MDWKCISKNITKAIESALEIGDRSITLINSSKKNLDAIRNANEIVQEDGDFLLKGAKIVNLASSVYHNSHDDTSDFARQLDMAADNQDFETLDDEIARLSSEDDFADEESCNDELSDTFVSLPPIETAVEALTALSAMGTEIAKAVQVCQIEETKRTEIRAKMEVEVTRINAISKLLSDYLDKTFDERSELFDNYFRVLDKAIEAGDIALMSATLGSINSLAAQSPFKNLADFSTVQQQLGQSGTEWDI